MTAPAAQPPTTLPPEDVAEYRRRLDEARAVMEANGFDGLVVGSGPPVVSSASISVGGHGRFAQPRYHRYFSGFHIWGGESFAPQPVVVVLPLTGEPTLVVRAGPLNTWVTLARAHSWIDKIVATCRDDAAWEERSNWGMTSPELPADVARALAESGLEGARLGLVGSWPGIEQTRAALTRATFEPTLTVDESGAAGDLLVHLVNTNSPWEIARLDRAQAIADEAMTAYMETARPGVPVDEVMAEARYRALRAGSEDAIFEITSGTDPWAMWVAPNQPRGARYADGDLVTVSLSLAYDGYWTQMSRTWLLGKPDREQQRVFDTARRSYDAMLGRIEPGVTGRALWDVGVAVIEEAGYRVRGRLGHSVGFTTVSGPEKFSILPDNDDPLDDGLAFVIHPCLWDKATGTVVQLGDSLVLENGVHRFLSQQPLTHDASLG